MTLKDAIIFILILLLVYKIFPLKYDSTDNWETQKRSGLVLYTDYGTGLQYIKGGPFGGITPRIGRDGKQMIDPDYENDKLED